MIDERLSKLAKILVDYSLEIKENDLFLISGNQVASPLVKEVYRRALDVGAHPYVHLSVDGLSEVFYKNASDEQLKFVSPVSEYEIKNIDARLSVRGPTNTRRLSNVDPKKQAMSSAAHQKIHQIFLDRAAEGDLRWCLTQYPTEAAAQDADMSLEEYEEFIFKAAHVHEKNPISYWKEVYENQEKIREFLQSKKQLRVVADDTDLTLSVKDRKWINCHGRQNFPDGEVFSGPVEDSAEGYVRYSFPAMHGGREVENIKLWFEKGKVVKAEASKGEQFLKSMVDMDKGSRRIGEFSFGLNSGIKKYTKNTLFDEKIGGTIHIAIGSGYPETGSKNQSGLHWDMMCDLRKNGEVYADGELVYKNGEFLSL